MPEVWNDGAYFNRNFVFRFGDCDRDKQASLHTIMRFFSELAGEDYEKRGLGYDRLAEMGRVFLISRMRLQFFQRPVHAQEVCGRTWERDTTGPFFNRDYELFSKSGALLAAGASQWLMVDIKSREIVRPALLQRDGRPTDPRKSNCPAPLRLKKRKDLPILGQRPVYYTDLDANGHVNNAVYSAIAMDFLPEDYRKKPLRDYSISFFTETGLGEQMTLSGQAEGDGFVLQGSAGGSPRFGCRFSFGD